MSITIAELADNPLVTRIEISIADPAAPARQPVARVLIDHRPPGGAPGDGLWHVSGPSVPKPEEHPWAAGGPDGFRFLGEPLATDDLQEALDHAATQVRLCTHRLEDPR